MQVSGVTCTVSGVSYTVGNTSCGTITVNKPTCTASGASGNIEIGATITPTVSCGNATKSGNATFSGTDWSANSSGGGSFTTSGSKTLSLSSVTCDSHSITGITGQNCPAVTVNVPTISTCTITTPLNAGATVTPTLACSNGGTPTGTNYTSTAGANTPINGSGKAVSVSSATTYTSVTVSGTCGGVAATGSCNNVTVNPSNACEFQQSWCPGVDWDIGILWGTNATSSPATGCYFVDGQNSGNPWSNQCETPSTCLVNGKTPTECNSAKCGPSNTVLPTADGGYYIYVNKASSNSQTNFQSIGSALSRPGCTPAP